RSLHKRVYDAPTRYREVVLTLSKSDSDFFENPFKRGAVERDPMDARQPEKILIGLIRFQTDARRGRRPGNSRPQAEARNRLFDVCYASESVTERPADRTFALYCRRLSQQTNHSVLQFEADLRLESTTSQQSPPKLRVQIAS